MGRKRQTIEGAVELGRVSVPGWMAEAIRRMARRTGLTSGDIVRLALAAYFDELQIPGEPVKLHLDGLVTEANDEPIA